MNIIKPLLSICIPTFNNIGFLQQNLKVLIPQIKNYYGIVELLINDNASDDLTSEIIEKLALIEDLDIKLKTQPINIGCHNNFIDVVARANGEYIYLLGDDDLVSPNILDVIIPFLERKEFDFIHFNRLVGNDQCSMNTLHDTKFENLIEELNFGEFVKRVMSSPNFISSNIFKKKLWDDGESFEIDQRYYGYEWLAKLYFSAARTNVKCLYYYMPLIIMRNPQRIWVRYNFLYIMIGMFNIFSDLDHKIPGVKEKWAQRIRNTHFYDFYLMLNDIAGDRELYCKYRDNINEICVNRREKVIVKFLLDFPCAKIISLVYPKLLKIYRLFRLKYRPERKIDF